ncbi:transcription termination factor Rho, partial [Jatrophihabitans sp.]|uniref:transcription termination factor Rho n=1 Tax=Jatrophihabitans sp. TaxID=1932789 RepID=UPI002D095236|nr:transcription termination factor Rho [Jatrophihabitans sp.]
MTDTQDQLIVLPGAESADASANNAAQERAKRRSGSLTSMLLPELQALASSMGIATGKMRKSDLIAAIQTAQRPQGSANGAAQPAPSAADAAPAATQAPPAARSRRSASRAVTTIEPAAAPPAAETSASNGTATAPAGNGTAEGASRTDGGDRQPERTRTRDGGRYRDGQNRDGQQGSSRDGQQVNGRDGQTRDNQTRDGQNRDSQNRDSQTRDNQQVNGRDNQTRDGQTRDGQTRDGQGRDNQNRDNQNRDGNRDFAGRDNNRNANRDGGRNDRNQGGSDDDEEYGQGRRPRRYRDRRGRSRDRADSGTSSRNDIEPTISEDDVLVPVAGIIDNVDDKGSWFIRVNGYFASSDDVYVSNSHVRRYNLRRGDAVTGAVRQAREGERKEKFNPLVRLDTINGVDPERARSRVEFTKLTPLYPQERLRLETEPHILTTRVIDLVMPIGKGQRALIVSPPKAGKTMIMQAIANAIATNNPECHLMVVLIDERPEEVTDMQRSVKGEVIASTFDRRPQDHTMVAELSIERAKRLVEMGHDVVVLLDSITRLGRAYNLAAPASGRILSGGVDSTALYPPKRFLGAARNIEDGGSLTIIASALVETGSAGDTVIFEEFKGTGNAELRLDRKIADKRVFPAVDVDQSSTRKEEILLSPDELAVVIKLRRVLHALDPQQGIDLLLDRLRKTRTNIEFLMQIAKTTPGAD